MYTQMYGFVVKAKKFYTRALYTSIDILIYIDIYPCYMYFDIIMVSVRHNYSGI